MTTPSEYIEEKRQEVNQSIIDKLPSNVRLKASQVRSANTTFFGAVFDTLDYLEQQSDDSTKNGGFIDYNDTSTTSSPISLSKDVTYLP